jgi:hypothetical protein
MCIRVVFQETEAYIRSLSRKHTCFAHFIVLQDRLNIVKNTQDSYNIINQRPDLSRKQSMTDSSVGRKACFHYFVIYDSSAEREACFHFYVKCLT